ncbi:unnamed protein product [Blepharisma stoltei]|uniref:Receptor ligand binding region domain-containing protein n=1 Tax=Blepharisma stoltei TaxID=1481888 RepID=A0AAU9IIE1_9CILI|nr:unnamed protein product [Blepharisma stoltei]
MREIKVLLRLSSNSVFLLFMLLISSYSLDVIIFTQTLSFKEAWENNILIPELVTPRFTYNRQETIYFLSSLEDPKILIDLADNIADHYMLSRECEELKVPHIVIEDNLKYYKSWTYSAISSRNSYESSLYNILNFFNWSEGFVFNSKKNSFLQEFILNLSSNFTSAIIEENSSINKIISYIVAPSGKSLFYLFTDSNDSVVLQEALISSKLIISGNGILLGKESYYNIIINGALAIVEQGQEYSKSDEDFIINAIDFVISMLDGPSIANSFDMKKVLDTSCTSHYCKAQFSLINVQYGERIIVGSFSSSNIYITKPIIFLGNSSAVPVSAKKTLPISINAGSTNYGSASDLNVPIYARGASLVISMVNEGLLDILENFQLSLFFFDCGATSYDSAYGLSCFSKGIDKFGLGHIASFPSSVAIGTIQTFKLLNLTLPIVGSCNSAPGLNSTELYPWYTRVQLSDSILASDMAPLIKSLGWSSVAVLYGNETYGISCYLWFKKYAEKNALNIVNPEWSRVIPPELTREESTNYINSLKGVYDSNARLILIFLYSGTTFGYILERFYDLGARKGDLVFLTTAGGIMVEIGFKDEYLYKRYEVGVPMMTFQGSIWVGTFGKKIYNNLKAKYKVTPSDYQCNFFDSTYLLSNAISSMINRGLDYTDPYKLNSTIRSIKMVGCLGTTSIAHGSNDNEFNTVTIDANQISNGTLSVYHIGLFNPLGSKLLTIDQPFIYGDNSIVQPSEFRNSASDCPFPDSKIITFSKGRIVIFCIGFAIALITAIITYYIWKKWWDVKIETLNQKQEISVQDFVVGISIGVEFLQIIAMGPDFKKIFSLLSSFADAISLNLASVIKLENGIFWAVCDLVLACCLLWNSLCATILLRLNERSNFVIFQYLDELGDFLMPILGNLCFIPFVSVLLDIFVCDEAIGNNFTESFLATDCYQFCWQRTHIIYVILAILALLTYEPLAVFCRPLWQEFQIQLHVKTLPLFLMVKTVVQVSLVVMNKTIKRAQSTVHAVLFVAVLICYVIFVHKYKPYNYQRYSWWEFISLIAVIWLSILATINAEINGSSYGWIMTLLAGWLAIGAYGFLIMRKKYPSLLFKAKGHDTSALFQFAFSFRKSTSKISGKSLNLQSSSRISPGIEIY